MMANKAMSSWNLKIGYSVGVSSLPFNSRNKSGGELFWVKFWSILQVAYE